MSTQFPINQQVVYFSGQKDSSYEDCLNLKPRLDVDSDEKHLEFGAACSSLITDLERLANQPRKRKRDGYSQTKVSKSCRLPTVESDILVVSSSFQAKDNIIPVAINMPKVGK